MRLQHCYRISISANVVFAEMISVVWWRSGIRVSQISAATGGNRGVHMRGDICTTLLHATALLNGLCDTIGRWSSTRGPRALLLTGRVWCIASAELYGTAPQPVPVRRQWHSHVRSDYPTRILGYILLAPPCAYYWKKGCRTFRTML